MADPSQEPPSSFSLVQGGLYYRIERLFGLVRERPPDPAKRVWVVFAITLLPLVVLAAMERVLYGSRVALPLLVDWTVYARFAIAVPLLIMGERSIDARLSAAVRSFRTSELVEGKAQEAFDAAIRKLERARDSMLPEAIILVGSFVMAWLNSHALLGLEVSSWRATTPGLESSTTPAGTWLDLVSLPLYNFLVFRWLWRIALWAILLRRVSRIDLNLVPTHPDGAAGLGFLGATHVAFSAFLVPVSATIAARGVQWVQYGGGTIESLQNALIAFGVIAIAIVLGPLLFFLPTLLKTKRLGLLEYGGFALEYTRRFDQKWLRGKRSDEQPLLGTGDIQSLADLANSYAIIRSMRIVPPSSRHALSLVLAIALPMVPFLAAIMPVKQILQQLLQLVTR